ncbi:MAG TPA: three-Cys-motif partner protein TcmP [Terriglobales bacterium]
MAKRKARPREERVEITPIAELFPDLPIRAPELKLPRLRDPIWTGNKASLVARYLYYFVLITHHGTYIDGFAGPQDPKHRNMWAAKLVLDSEPKFITKFFICDAARAQVKRLTELKAQQPKEPKRLIEIFAGDFNRRVDEILVPETVSKSQAAFCLLDQRTFECEWSTLKKLAAYKADTSNRIELFYFLATGWLHRALAGVRKPATAAQVSRWWGRDDWGFLRELSGEQIRDLVVSRFKAELGYKYVMPFPIFERAESEVVMYYMIHATDHDVAPSLMARAYRRAVRKRESAEQFAIDFPQALDVS